MAYPGQGTSLMLGLANYSVVEHLRDGRSIEVRSLRASDKEQMLDAVESQRSQSIQRPFFGPKQHFPEQEIAFFLNIDFERHVALVAQIEEDEGAAIVGGGRVTMGTPGQAEVAFVVIDAYQSQAIATILMSNLTILARKAGVRQLLADVLREST